MRAACHTWSGARRSRGLVPNASETLHLSEECRQLLTKARGLVEVNVIEDPRYSVADDALG